MERLIRYLIDKNMSIFNFKQKDIKVTSSNSFEDTKIVEYKGFIVSNVTLGRHVGRDFLAGIRNFFGGRSHSWEKSLERGQQEAFEELAQEAERVGANGIIAVRLEDEPLGGKGGMMNIKASGTAVVISS